MKLAVSEVFGTTFQGEGPSTGRRAIFLRLAGCNLKCGINDGWKCDTPYTWDWRGEIGPQYSTHEQVRMMEPAEVMREIADHADSSTSLVVITGGEPLLQAKALDPVIRGLSGYSIEFETNGTLPPPWLYDQFVRYNVSPKLESSGNPLKRRLNVAALRSFVQSGQAHFKFVIAGSEDLEEVQELCRIAGIPPGLVWLMPEGTSAENLLHNGTAVAEDAIANGYNFTQRLHVLTWGNERGR